MASRHKIETEIGKIEDNCFIPYFTNGSWSAHQLLEYLLEQTGPAEVYFTAYSLSESSVRSIFFLIEERKITRVHCLFNKEIRRIKTDLALFANEVIPNIRITDVHAKLIIIENEKWKVCVITSANLTENNKHEAGCIFTVSDKVERIKQQFIELYNNSMPLYE